MIAIGVGCRKGCPADDIVALVRKALAALPADLAADGMFSIADKRGEPGLAEAAAALGLPLEFLDRSVMQLFVVETKTRSQRIEDRYGLPSVAETAALAGAGERSTLLVARFGSPRATCAIAEGEGRSTPRRAIST